MQEPRSQPVPTGIDISANFFGSNDSKDEHPPLSVA
jgi:hypothetical protein